MNGERWARRVLPRLAPGQARAANLWNAAGLLATALVGAGLVHLLAYHVPLGVPLGSRWIATALALLAHCPLRGPLGLVATIAVLAPLLAFRELRRLERLLGALARALAARHAPVPPAHELVPRSPWRLAGFIALLLSVQVPLLGIAGVLWPMQGTMVMGGTLMTMTRQPTLPLGLLHLVAATLLALLLWRVEHCLTRLRAQIAQRLRLLSRWGGAAQPLTPTSRTMRLPRTPYGHALFARPPPRAA
jgi:hypothetical protein